MRDMLLEDKINYINELYKVRYITIHLILVLLRSCMLILLRVNG